MHTLRKQTQDVTVEMRMIHSTKSKETSPTRLDGYFETHFNAYFWLTSWNG